MKIPGISSQVKSVEEEGSISSDRSLKQKTKPRFGWRHLRWTAFVITLIVLEYPLTVAGLALTGIADPNTYRTKLWKDGSLNGFNSDPSTPLLQAAMYRPVNTPLVWSGTLTQFNLIICVLSMFILLVKTCLLVVHWFSPVFSVIAHGLLIGLYSYSLYGQTSSDTIDPHHINNGPPWYITKSCDVAHDPSNIGFCKQAKALFYVFIFLFALFFLNFATAIISMIFAPDPSRDEESTRSPTDRVKRWSKEMRHTKDLYASRRSGYMEQERQWEMVPVPDTPGMPKSPMTPRTTAFKALEGGGDLPLRNGGYFPPPPKKGMFR